MTDKLSISPEVKVQVICHIFLTVIAKTKNRLLALLVSHVQCFTLKKKTNKKQPFHTKSKFNVCI